MKKILLILVTLIALTSNNNQLALANDTALTALGDNVGPFQGTPQVVLDHEIINLNVYQNKTEVDVTFYLKNVGSKQNILVGFPDEFASYKIHGQEDYDFTPIEGPINNFKTYLRGVPVNSTVKYQILKKDSLDGKGQIDYKELWHTFPVTFNPAETVIIRNTYWVENGLNVVGEKNFRYTLMTGKKWKGPIGNTKIYVNLKNGLTASDILKKDTNKGMTVIANNKLMWEYKNFEPDEKAGTAYFFLFFKKNFANVLKTRLLTENDLQGLSDWELKVLRNEIYARHGRPFKSESLNGYFLMANWYKANPNYSDKVLNSFEKKNAEIILNYEKKKGSKIIFKDL